MKRYLFFLLIWLPFILNAQFSTPSRSMGTVSMEVTVLESKVEKAMSPAQLQAIYQILFRGVPGTAYETPLLTTNEDDWFNTFPDYFEQLLDEKRGRYSSFVVSSVLVSKGKNVDKKKYVTLQICVNVSALQSDLENHGIKRRFGL